MLVWLIDLSSAVTGIHKFQSTPRHSQKPYGDRASTPVLMNPPDDTDTPPGHPTAPCRHRMHDIRKNRTWTTWLLHTGPVLVNSLKAELVKRKQYKSQNPTSEDCRTSNLAMAAATSASKPSCFSFPLQLLLLQCTPFLQSWTTRFKSSFICLSS